MFPEESTEQPDSSQPTRADPSQTVIQTVVLGDAASGHGTGPRQIGEYEILRELGRGGMGIVYKARHQRLGRIAAVKVIRAGELADGEEIRRFHAEAQAAAQLDHSGIVQVYEVGQDGNHHFMAMAFVDGQSLAEMVRTAPLEPGLAAQLVLQATRAVQAAHDQGIIHRDLKPQNILVTGDRLARVADFGLAKKTSTDAGLTATGQILGTPGYMPPEQASGRMHEVGPQADIYSLGATLYCLLTGRPPFQAASLAETLRQVIDEFPVPPRLLNPAIPADLQSICLKCLSKRPIERYATCTELAADLQRFLEGISVNISRSNWMSALARTLQRSRDDVQIKSWGIILYYFAAIVWLAETNLFWHFMNGPPYSQAVGLATRAVQFSSMGMVVYLHRSAWQKTQSVAAEQMWSVWLGFLIACHVVVCLAELHVTRHTEKTFEILAAYPLFAVLSGFLFFALGRNFWGYCYAFGALFFALAMLFPWCLPWSPLLFGTAWGVVLAILGRRLRNLPGTPS